jgi:hypothetical protein
MDSADGSPITLTGRTWPHVPLGGPSPRAVRWIRAAVVLAGLTALTVYLHPGLAAPHAHWPLWDVHVYWWGGQQASRGGTLYAPGTRYSFTYPPFAAALFTIAAHAPEGDLAAVITVASTGALTVLCALSLGTAGVRRRPEAVFAVTALALLTWPVAYTLHLGEVNLILAALAGTDLLRRHDGHWWQGIATGLAAGIKLTPLIFVAYLLITRRVRAAATLRRPSPSAWCCCRHSPGCSGWMACSMTRRNPQPAHPRGQPASHPDGYPPDTPPAAPTPAPAPAGQPPRPDPGPMPRSS